MRHSPTPEIASAPKLSMAEADLDPTNGSPEDIPDIADPDCAGHPTKHRHATMEEVMRSLEERRPDVQAVLDYLRDK